MRLCRPMRRVVDRDGRHQAPAPVAAGEGVPAADGDTRAGSQPTAAAARGCARRCRGGYPRPAYAQVMVRELHCPRCRVASRPPRVMPLDAVTRGHRSWAMGAEGTAPCPPAPATLTRPRGTRLPTQSLPSAAPARCRDDNQRAHAQARRPARGAWHRALAGRDCGVRLCRHTTGTARSRASGCCAGGLGSRLDGDCWRGLRLRPRIPCATRGLSRKVASPLGLAEVVPVRVRYGAAEPLASGYWPLAAIAQADGWILVPPDSEGYPAGAEVVVRPWP